MESRLLRQRSFDHAQKLITEGSALIDGKRASARVLAHVAEKTRALAAQGLTPG